MRDYNIPLHIFFTIAKGFYKLNFFTPPCPTLLFIGYFFLLFLATAPKEQIHQLAKMLDVSKERIIV